MRSFVTLIFWDIKYDHHFCACSELLRGVGCERKLALICKSWDASFIYNEQAFLDCAVVGVSSGRGFDIILCLKFIKKLRWTKSQPKVGLGIRYK